MGIWNIAFKIIISHAHHIHSSEHGHKDGNKREQYDDPGKSAKALGAKPVQDKGPEDNENSLNNKG